MCEDCREIVHVLTSEENVCLECGSEKLVKWNPVKGKCPKCGEKMKKTGTVFFVD